MMNEVEVTSLTLAPESWRTPDMMTMRSRHLILMNNSTIPALPHDARLIVGSKREVITCHKLFLSIVSSWFENQFKLAPGVLEELELPEFEPDAVNILIHYVYLWEIIVETIPEAIGVARLATYYKIPELVDHSSKFMENNFQVENIIDVYEAAVSLDMESVVRNAHTFIIKRFGDVMQAENFHHLSPEHLQSFVQLDDLPANSEVDLCKAAIRWGEKHCEMQNKEINVHNIRGVLGDGIINAIRFPTMSVDVFCKLVNEMKAADKQIITEEDITALFMYYNTHADKRNASTLKFSKELRTCQRVTTVNFENGGYGEDAFDYDNTNDSFQITTVTSGTHVLLKAVGFKGRLSQVTETVEIEIRLLTFNNLHGEHEELSRKTSKTVTCAGEMFYIHFDIPTPLEPLKDYIVEYNIIKGGLFKWGNILEEITTASLDGKCATVKYSPYTASLCGLKLVMGDSG